jgi:hypothetical protein
LTPEAPELTISWSMPRPTTPHPRKLLVASIGVATMTYVASTTFVAACGGSTSPGARDSGNAQDAVEDYPVANLAVIPDARPNDAMQMDDFPVANLAVMPDAGHG